MKLKRAYSPGEVLNMKIPRYEFTGAWQASIGNPAKSGVWIIWGASGNGKSSFVMQLAKELCSYGGVLYLSYEEGVTKSFQDRINRYKMNEVQGKFRVATDDTLDDLRARLKKRKSAKFVIIDSFQYSNWSYEQAKTLADDFPRKCFIFISQEYKGQPLGKPAARLKYMAGMKVRVQGYKAYCQGRAIGEAGEAFTVWEDGVIQTSNET